MRTVELIDDLSAVLREQMARARAVKALPSEALLHRPAPEQWNALEILEHLNLSSGIYVRGLEKVFAERAAALPFNPAFRVLFNSYYQGVGAQHPRALRGLITRPGLDIVKHYRAQVDERIAGAQRRGRDQVEIELAAEALLDDFQV